MARISSWLLWLCVMLSFGACIGSSADSSVGVFGTVLLDGLPVEEGFITFQPTQEEYDGHVKTEQIQNGKYNFGHAGGLVPGSYKVTITQMRNGAQSKMEYMENPKGTKGDLDGATSPLIKQWEFKVSVPEVDQWKSDHDLKTN